MLVGTKYNKNVFIDENGRVYSDDKDLKIITDKYGNKKCSLNRTGNSASSPICVSRLMMDHYIEGGNKGSRKIIHIDGDKENCELKNLRYFNDSDKKKAQKILNKKHHEEYGYKQLIEFKRKEKRKCKFGIPNIISRNNKYWIYVSPYKDFSANNLESAVKLRNTLDNLRWGDDTVYQYTVDDYTGERYLDNDEKPFDQFETIEELLENIKDYTYFGNTRLKKFDYETCAYSG